jgi:hypothetical protein
MPFCSKILIRLGIYFILETNWRQYGIFETEFDAIAQHHIQSDMSVVLVAFAHPQNTRQCGVEMHMIRWGADTEHN